MSFAGTTFHVTRSLCCTASLGDFALCLQEGMPSCPHPCHQHAGQPYKGCCQVAVLSCLCLTDALHLPAHDQARRSLHLARQAPTGLEPNAVAHAGHALLPVQCLAWTWTGMQAPGRDHAECQLRCWVGRLQMAQSSEAQLAVLLAHFPVLFPPKIGHEENPSMQGQDRMHCPLKGAANAD